MGEDELEVVLEPGAAEKCHAGTLQHRSRRGIPPLVQSLAGQGVGELVSGRRELASRPAGEQTVLVTKLAAGASGQEDDIPFRGGDDPSGRTRVAEATDVDVCRILGG